MASEDDEMEDNDEPCADDTESPADPPPLFGQLDGGARLYRLMFGDPESGPVVEVYVTSDTDRALPRRELWYLPEDTDALRAALRNKEPLSIDYEDEVDQPGQAESFRAWKQARWVPFLSAGEVSYVGERLPEGDTHGLLIDAERLQFTWIKQCGASSEVQSPIAPSGTFRAAPTLSGDWYAGEPAGTGPAG